VQAKASAAKILALEIKMSNPRLDRVERRDGRLQYNPMTIAELQKMTPAINWKTILQVLVLQNGYRNCITTKYMKALQTILSENNVSAWKEYMKWTLLNGSTGLLSSTVDAANFDFYGKTLTGAIKQRPLEDRALQTVNGTIGEALVNYMLKKCFLLRQKQKAEKMIHNIILAYQNRINNLTWMSAETKVKAVEKLNKINIKIGYPDKWKDYSKLDIKNIAQGGSYFENMKNLSRWNFQKISTSDKPVDKTEWYMSPQTVNAYYNPAYNEIVFPAF
jgi:endothelin-converting enzyme/putative endopeptidase